MANVKSRPKTQTSAKKRCGGKNNHVNNTVESIAVMKNASVKPSEDKVQYLVQNKEIFNDNLSKPKSNSNKTDNKVKKKIFSSLVTKTGRIKKKDKKKLSLLDNILKSELLITDTDKNSRSNRKKVVNNNDNAINNQNKPNHFPNGIKAAFYFRQGDKKKTKKKEPKSTPEKVSKSVQVDAETSPLVYECDYCGKYFKTKSCIEKHIYGHLNLKPHQCPHCPKKFHYRLNMQVHVMKLHAHSEELIEPSMCNICGKVFILKESLNAHLTTHHSKKASFFKCIYCENKFSDFTQLTEHEKKHLVTGRYQCPTCGYSYGIRDHFEAHLKSHIKVKDYVCQHCGKEFLRLNSMQRHVLVCHVGHRIQCPICKKKLKGHLTEHLRTHDKKRPHECPECGQCFTQSTQLTVHRRSHTGARPYPCKICSRCFSHSTALMLHIRRHTGEKPFRCAMCPLQFSQLPHMKAHMRTIHGKENAYKCKKCAQFFKLKVDLERHEKNCSADDREINGQGKKKSSVNSEENESATRLTRMRYLLALLLTIISTKDKLKYLGA